MIPLPVAPLHGISVLVTRPIAEAEQLAQRIESAGGTAVIFPAIEIQPTDIATDPKIYDWIIFTSVNAVRHGFARITLNESTRIATIGKTTKAALEENGLRIDASPDKEFTSEALLSHPALTDVNGRSILIVKGAGGRDILQTTLSGRGAQVATLDVYRRVKPSTDDAMLRTLEERWREGIDILTLLSVETLDNLHDAFTDPLRSLLCVTPFVTVSKRIADAAHERGLRGECVLARSADDDAIVGAIAAWHARAR